MSRTHFYQCSKIHQLPELRGGEESQEDSLKITSDEIFPKAWTWTWFQIFMWFYIEEVLNLTNLLECAEQPNSCTSDENSTKNWKKMNLTSYKKDFHSISWRNNSHSIPRSISWDSIENKFSQSMMKNLVSWGSMKEKVRSWVKECFCIL